MIDAELLAKLCCPETHQRLRWAEPALLARLNARVASGQLCNRAGQVVSEKLEGGLVREDGRYLYPVYQQIPILLVDEALGVGEMNERAAGGG